MNEVLAKTEFFDEEEMAKREPDLYFQVFRVSVCLLCVIHDVCYCVQYIGQYATTSGFK
jgi:hypothetical protein